MIEVAGLSKSFGITHAVKDITFDVPRGQILGFLGPNGAGKSTTMKMLTCFIEPSRGDARVGGKSILNETLAVRQQIGYLPENAPSYEEMTVREFLHFIAEVRGLAKVRAAAERMRGLCALSAVWHRPIETLSKGYRQRVGFAQALLHDPPVLILDEPTDGLDPNQKHDVRRIIRDMAVDKTIILSTHILEEAEQLCERVIIIADGEIVADATPAELKSQSRYHNAVTVDFAENFPATAVDELATCEEIAEVERLDDKSLRVYPRNGKSLTARVMQMVKDKNWRIKQVFGEQGRLDEVFRKLTLIAGR